MSGNDMEIGEGACRHDRQTDKHKRHMYTSPRDVTQGGASVSESSTVAW